MKSDIHEGLNVLDVVFTGQVDGGDMTGTDVESKKVEVDLTMSVDGD